MVYFLLLNILVGQCGNQVNQMSLILIYTIYQILDDMQKKWINPIYVLIFLH